MYQTPGFQNLSLKGGDVENANDVDLTKKLFYEILVFNRWR